MIRMGTRPPLVGKASRLPSDPITTESVVSVIPWAEEDRRVKGSALAIDSGMVAAAICSRRRLIALCCCSPAVEPSSSLMETPRSVDIISPFSPPSPTTSVHSVSTTEAGPMCIKTKRLTARETNFEFHCVSYFINIIKIQNKLKSKDNI